MGDHPQETVCCGGCVNNVENHDGWILWEFLDGWMHFGSLRLQNFFYAEELKIKDSWVGLI
jgi:hypothetical protein